MSKTELVQQLDQLGTSLENVAELMSIYYKSLREKGVRKDLAQKLVVDFNRAMWSSIGKPKENL